MAQNYKTPPSLEQGGTYVQVVQAKTKQNRDYENPKGIVAEFVQPPPADTVGLE